MENRSEGKAWFAIIVLLVAFAGAILVLSGDDAFDFIMPPTDRQPRQYVVVYQTGVFSPTNVHIRVNDTVTFRNESSTAITLAPLTTADVGQKNSYTHTFISAGTYPYYNGFRPNERGMITVQP